jgi:hypothetical protein
MTARDNRPDEDEGLRARMVVLDLIFRAFDHRRIGRKQWNEAKDGRNRVSLWIQLLATAASELHFDENEAKDA